MRPTKCFLTGTTVEVLARRPDRWQSHWRWTAWPDHPTTCQRFLEQTGQLAPCFGIGGMLWSTDLEVGSGPLFCLVS